MEGLLLLLLSSSSSILELESVQMNISFLFFTFTLSFLSLSLLLFFQRLKPWWCSCHVCRAYLKSTWRSEFDNLSDWYAHLLRHSPTGTIHIHVLGNIITANPDNVHYILRTRFHNFPKGKPFSSILGDLLGNGIFNVDGDLWRFQRKMASLELGSVSVRSYAFSITTNELRQRLFPLLDSISNNKTNANNIAEAATIDLQDVFRRFSFDTICKMSFGLDPGCLQLSLPVSEFAAAFDLASCLSAKRALTVTPILWKLKRLLNWGSERDLKKAIGLVNALAEEVIRQRRKLGFAQNHDLLSRFMATVNDDDDKYLRDIVISFMLAGRDTVASGLTTFFYLLSKTPEVVCAMREEIDSVMGEEEINNEEEMVSYDQLRSMHYVHAALYESLRLFPPIQFNSKFCAEDDVLPDGTFVNKDTRVTYHSYAMGRMESIWGDDCHAFRPDRWLRDGVFVPESPFRYPVFNAGARVCLGKEMSLMEMQTVAVSVIRRFDIEPVDGSAGARSPRFAPGLTASLSGGLPVRVVPRRMRRPSGGPC